jgi:hypothetical protein
VGVTKSQVRPKNKRDEEGSLTRPLFCYSRPNDNRIKANHAFIFLTIMASYDNKPAIIEIVKWFWRALEAFAYRVDIRQPKVFGT